VSSKLVVCDAGPLIILARIEKLCLLRHLFDVIFLTPTVQEECSSTYGYYFAYGLESSSAHKNSNESPNILSVWEK